MLGALPRFRPIFIPCRRLLSMSSPNASPVASSSSSVASSAAPADAPLLPTSPEAVLADSLDRASALLRNDLPVAFPTETVYGLGASALSSTAVKRIFAAKGRPSDNPLIVHVSSRDMLSDLVPTNRQDGRPAIPKMYEALMDRFWPGPLSLIFPLDLKGKGKAVNLDPAPQDCASQNPPRRAVAPEVTAGQPSLCVRMPSHPLALSLIRHTDLPLAAPSANLSSRPSPTTAAHVMEDLGHGRGVGAILDGGSCEVGVESTVVDWVPPADGGKGEGELRVLRAGGVSAEEIEACLRDAGFGTAAADSDPASNGAPKRIRVYARDFHSQDLEERPTTPGMKYKHYAPGNAKVVLVKPVKGSSTEGPLPSLQDLVQLTALTHAPAAVSGDDGDDSITPSRFRVGLMLTDTTLSALGVTSLSAVTPACDLVRLPPAPPSPFANLAEGEESNLPELEEIDVLSYSLGSRDRPLDAAQRLFAGLRFLDHYVPDHDPSGKTGVDLIFVEAVPEEGVGLAVMERARKAAGGQPGEMEFQL